MTTLSLFDPSEVEGYELYREGIPNLLPMQGRSDGVHVSSVIRHLCLKLNHFDDTGEGPDLTRLQLGNAMEDTLASRYAQDNPNKYVTLGELMKDGIYGTPDLFDVQDMSIIEIKLTWLSSNHGPDSLKFWKYWVQVKAYCYMLGVTLGRLCVCHINGGYGKEGGGPVYREWQREFSRQELGENWALIKTGAVEVQQVNEGG